MGKKTPRRIPPSRTRRSLKGGSIESVTKVVKELPITAESVSMLNEDSKYVVATYWWGEKNVNRNLQFPCPEEIVDEATQRTMLAYWAAAPEIIKTSLTTLRDMKKKRAFTPEEMRIRQDVKRWWNGWKGELKKNPVFMVKLTNKKNELLNLYRDTAEKEAKQLEDDNKAILEGPADSPEARKLRSLIEAKRSRAKDRYFPEMIEEWKGFCTRARVNHLALQTEFERTDYQNGINAKPLFIKKVLDYLKEKDPENPKGVLYIDGDMWVHKAPKLFELEDVDFMARSWNIDSRSQEESVKKPFFDPMIFETSGGTMFFGNTEGARRLLDRWEADSARQPGKADDRILSQVFTTSSMVININIVGLPIEYLWLTDKYEKFLNKTVDTSEVTGTGGVTIDDAIIEHPYCLTGEERAAEMNTTSDRQPDGYDDEVSEAINYKKPSEVLYEYIIFNGHEEIRDELEKYMKFITRVGFHSQVPMAVVIPFADKYGEYNEIATTNGAELPAQTRPTGKTVSIVSGSVKEILSALRSGNNVWTGPEDPPELEYPDIDCYAKDASKKKEDNADWYTRYVQVAADQPMFFSSKSPVLQHLLLMCETLGDMNKHLKGSYTFLSRIRWEIVKPKIAKKKFLDESKSSICAAEFPKIVHQIWFGGNDPGWRQTLFDKNRALCEEYGYTYKLWIESDRIRENFPITFEYQEKSRAEMAGKPQSRWAQIADLARLEIVHSMGGIYADSIIELSPALLMAVETEISRGFRFVGCNEDPCDPFGTDPSAKVCEGDGNRSYLSNAFFAAVQESILIERLLEPEVLNSIKFDDPNINQTTGPYLFRKMIKNQKDDAVSLLQSDQIYKYRVHKSKYSPVAPDRFIVKDEAPGSIKVKDGQYFIPGGIEILQQEFLKKADDSRTLGAALTYDDYVLIVKNKGPLAIYHAGLGGTWLES